MAPFPNPILKRGIDMKYKVLVADDEYIIRSGIISFLKRYDDFEVAAEAEDGEMALEEAEKQDIDVYFVDINMPFLNGLQFIEKLKGVHPDALVVVITGYDRFEYARKALQLGTFEYLLKPIMEKPFDEMIQRVRKQLAEQSRKDKYLDWARRELEKNRKRLTKDAGRALFRRGGRRAFKISGASHSSGLCHHGDLAGVQKGTGPGGRVGR